MSPRAACRLEALGFTRVYDYVDGIADWKAALAKVPTPLVLETPSSVPPARVVRLPQAPAAAT